LVDVNTERTLLTLLDRGTPVLARSLAYKFPEDAEALETYASRLSKHLQQTYYACEHVLQQPYEPDLLLVSGVRGDQASILAKELQEVDDIQRRSGASRQARIRRTRRACRPLTWRATPWPLAWRCVAYTVVPVE
jgi:hypothetical protein